MSSDAMSFQLVQNALNVANLRQQVYANNIANADTPGFKRSDVQFETALSQALVNQGSGALGQTYIPLTGQQPMNLSGALGVQPTVVTDTTTAVDSNGNNVNVDDEMVNLAQNQLKYNVLAQDLTLRISMFKNAIGG
jgi:flagellar basal-body rod protein FlgB